MVFLRCRHTMVPFVGLREEAYTAKAIVTAFDAFSIVMLGISFIGATLLWVGWRRYRKKQDDERIYRYTTRGLFLSLISFFLYFNSIFISGVLFFFFQTNTDVGITRRLKPPMENVEKVKVNERNVMYVLIDKNDGLTVNGYPSDISTLKDEVKFFITPRPNDESAPEVESRDIENLGEVLLSKGVISLQNDRGTSYAMYIMVQNEVARAFNELREDMAWERFHKHFDQLDEEQTKAICEAIPIRVSEAEPVERDP